MKKEAFNKLTEMGLFGYYLEIYDFLFIFALRKEQFIHGLEWYNNFIQDIFTTDDMEQVLNSFGLCTSIITDKHLKNKKFQILSIPIDTILETEEALFHKPDIRKIMSIASHEIQHAVLNVAHMLKGDQTSPQQQEPLAYLAEWITDKFFIEAERQGYIFTISKK
jgi:hypothetical protein